MAKKSASTPRSKRGSLVPTPPLSNEEWRTGLIQAAQWADLRASEDDLAELALLITDQEFQRELASLQLIVQRDRDTLARNGGAMCALMDWRLRSIFIEGYVAIHSALHQFLPERASLLTEQHRRELFVAWLILRARRQSTDAAAALRWLNTYEVLGRHAFCQLGADVEGQLGALYGAIPLIQAAAEAHEPGAAEELNDTLQALVKLSWKHLPPSLKEQDPKEVSLLVASALGETLITRVNPSGDPLEAAIRGLEEKFNILPKAVANVVSKDARHDGRYRAITVDFRSPDDDPADDESHAERQTDVDVSTYKHRSEALPKRSGKPMPVRDAPPPVEQEEQQKTLQSILAWIDADPTRKAAYCAMVKERTQDNAAKIVGISKPTLRKHIKQLQADLRRCKPFFS